MYRLSHLIAETINILLIVHKDLCPLHICVAPGNSRTARCIFGKSVALQKLLIINKKLGVVHKSNPQRVVAVALFVGLFLMSSDPCSRRNSELCLFGFNHCEVSAQLCKTCVTNLSKKHTEERQEAEVW